MRAVSANGEAVGSSGPESAAGRIRQLVERALGPGMGFGPAEAVAAASTADVAHFLHPHFDDEAKLELLGVGVPASPGAASGRVVLSADAALEAAERGESVILVRLQTGPEDVIGMQAADGILTARGGLASHAAVVARAWGIPAVVGLSSLDATAEGVTIDGQAIAADETISIDGHSGQVYRGSGVVQTEYAPSEIDTLLGWADALRAGRFEIRANADDEATARQSRALGAKGIGLCRTEHMFLAEDRLPLMRRLILSQSHNSDDEALHALEEAQTKDFEALLESMEGYPVTVRLLDPPLHEFLPPIEPLIAAEARSELDEEGQAQLTTLRRLHEVNPMIGTRGVRLGVIKPGLYPMQVRAVSRAVGVLRERGLSPQVEIMIPLVVDASELELARGWLEQAVAEVKNAGSDTAISIGTMIETPRAALVAGELAGIADFFSFGTNDLTQLTYALSRDDVEADLLPRYMKEGLLDSSPFEVLDEVGVGYLVRHAVDAARSVKPSIKIGACGEQAGDPASVRFLVANGLDYVSCSPYRLPVVRLAVAQALLQLGLVDGGALQSKPPQVRLEPNTEIGPKAAAQLPGPTPNDVEFRISHALRIKGFATSDMVAEVSGVDIALAVVELQRLKSREMVKFHETRSFWQLTPAGREIHASRLPGTAPERLQTVRAIYAQFLDLNVAVKELCSSWQVRDGIPNDHSDPDYDEGHVTLLAALHDDSRPVLHGLADAIERLHHYQVRLTRALGRVKAGEADAFTGVMKQSYHDIWMELHEDLLLLLSIDRAAECNF